MRIPEGRDDLTAEWLTSALRQGGLAAEVTSFKFEPLTAGLVGQTVRITLGYSAPSPGGPPSIIAKLSSADPRMRKQSVGKYANEVLFYRHIALSSPLPTPQCYVAEFDPKSGRHVLLLEDIGLSVALADRCTPEQARHAITAIAAFHAHWWESPELDGLDWLPAPTHDPVEWQKLHDGWWPQFLRKAGNTFPAAMLEIGEKLGPKRGEIMDQLFGGSPRTLIHRDYHLNNMVFGEPGATSPFSVFDWQSLSFGRGVWDVAYFMCQSLDIETRRSTEEDLLLTYHQSLLEGGVRGYSFETCMRDFRLALLQRFGSLISTIAAMPFAPEQIQRHIDVLLPRNIAAVLDHDAGALLN